MRLTEDNLDRLVKLVMEQKSLDFTTAEKFLASLRLKVSCGDELRGSAATQACLLSIVNAGKRAFRGGVFVEMPSDVELQVPWPKVGTLNDAVAEIGAKFGDRSCDYTYAISTSPRSWNRENSNQVFTDGWVGGICPPDLEFAQRTSRSFALSGVLAGGIAVGRGFLNTIGLLPYDVDEVIGISLWSPNEPWDSDGAIGPDFQFFPEKLTLLGLGHLGQACVWALGLQPQVEGNQPEIHLVDFDKLTEANWASGLICEQDTIGKLKTRVAQNWLESRNYETRLVERRVESDFKIQSGEPRVSICGFDNGPSRMVLDKAGWDLVVDIGIGGTINTFDSIRMNTFPDSTRSPESLFANSSKPKSSRFEHLYAPYLGEGECGMLAANLAGKSIATAFVGQVAAAVAIGEVLRGLHGGKRLQSFNLSLRDEQLSSKSTCDQLPYLSRLVPNGFVAL